MEITLLDYKGNKQIVEVSNDIDFICGKIISGDMVMEYPFDYDTNIMREYDFFDGGFIVNKENFPKLAELENGAELAFADFNCVNDKYKKM